MVEVTKHVPKKPDRRSAGAAVEAKKRRRSTEEGTKQGYLSEDMTPLRDKQIDAKGAELIEALDQRKIWMEKAKPAREALIDMMIKKGLDEYLLEVDSRTFKLELCKETKVSAKKLKIMPDEE